MKPDTGCIRAFFIIAVALLAVACTGPEEENNGSSTFCEPGEVRSCSCGTASGTTTCANDGASWGECLCPDTGMADTGSTDAEDTSDTGEPVDTGPVDTGDVGAPQDAQDTGEPGDTGDTPGDTDEMEDGTDAVDGFDSGDVVDAGGCSPACADPSPVCDQATGTCVECLADSDCAGGSCDTSANTCSEPDISVSPSMLAFGTVPAVSDSAWLGEGRYVRVRNRGSEVLTIDAVSISGAQSMRVAFPEQNTTSSGAVYYLPANDRDTLPFPVQVQPNDVLMLRVWFEPTDDAAAQAALTIESDDPGDPSLDVSVYGNAGRGCISTSVEQASFGKVNTTEGSSRLIAVENCSRTDDLDISQIALQDDAGGAFVLPAAQLPGTPTTLVPGERRTFAVEFAPGVARSYTGEVVIENDTDGSPNKLVTLTGSGTNLGCPTVTATASTPGNSQNASVLSLEPLSQVNLVATATDPDSANDQVAFQWSVVDAPSGSTSTLLPSNTFDTPSFFVDLAGTYEFELRAFDPDATAHCGAPTTVTVDAVPTDTVYAELVWDTPADLDQADGFGAEFDIHYLHPMGTWEEDPWDVYWRNPNPNWGDSTTSNDDPVQEIDDTDGAGPEAVRHSGLEGLSYQLGAFYFTDRNLGSSYVRMRVYVGGALDSEVRGYVPVPNMFWHAATIDGSNETVQEVDQLTIGYP